MQTNDKVGDGSTTAMVLAQAILSKGLENMGVATGAFKDNFTKPNTA